MEKIYQFIVENTGSGKIDRESAIQLLKMLKQAETTVEPIAIIGLAAQMPGANSPTAFWENIQNQKDCLQTCPENRRREIESYFYYKKFPLQDVKYQIMAYLEAIDRFDPQFFRLSPKEASLMDPNQRLFLETAWSALEDAGYGGNKLSGSQTGVYLGFSSKAAFSYDQLIADIQPEAVVEAVAGNLPSVIASRISYLLDLKGPSMLIDTACSSSLVAVHLACQGLQNRDCDYAIAGGVKILLAPFASDYKLGIESADGRTRTFDEQSTGCGGGEGVVAFLLKPLAKALKDQDHVYAVIKGSAVNQDGSSIGITAPNVTAQENVILQAWEKAGIDPETITYLEAHGTGTQLGDPIEIEGIRRAFGQKTTKRQFCAISSLKSNLGHLDHAAGSAGLLRAVLALKSGELPPAMHFERTNRKIHFEDSPVYVNDRLRRWEVGAFPRRCGVSAFGLSGTNCHVVLEEAPLMMAPAKNDHHTQILTISAQNQWSFRQLIHAYREFLETEKAVDLTRICYTANTGRGHYNYRLAIITSDLEALKEKIKSLDKADFTTIQPQDSFTGFHVVTGAQKSDRADHLTHEQKLQLEREVSAKIGQFTPGIKDHDYQERLRELAKLYIQGADIPWEKIYAGQSIPKISLPTYPFERNRCWLEIPAPAASNQSLPGSDPSYYTATWIPEALDSLSAQSTPGAVLVIHNQPAAGEEIMARLTTAGKEVTLAGYSSGFQRIDRRHFEVDGSRESFLKLLGDIQAEKLTQIVYFSAKASTTTGLGVNANLQNEEVFRFLNLIQALLSRRHPENPAEGIGGPKENPADSRVEILIVAESVNRVTGRERRLNPEGSLLFGLGKAVNVEQPRLKLRCLDLDERAGVPEIIAELQPDLKAYLTAYRNGRRYLETMSSLPLDVMNDYETKFQKDGVYLITGGMGGIGLEFGKYLATKHPINIALVNRTALPERARWDELLQKGMDSKTTQRIQLIREMEERGCQVTCYQADVSKKEELQPVIEEMIRKFGKINGIIHAAGISAGNLMARETPESLSRVLAAKVTGTWLLDHLTQSQNLDFLVLFSSAITAIGGIGAGAYTAANSYLDAFAGYGRLKGRRTLTINWPTWKDTGFTKGVETSDEKLMFQTITPLQALNAFEQVFKKDVERVIIGAMNYESPVFALRDSLPLRFSKELEAAIQAREDQRRVQGNFPLKSTPVLLQGQPTGGYTEDQQKLAQIWGKVFGLTEVSIYTSFYELGGDSILALKLWQEIVAVYPSVIEVTHIYSYPTIAEMAAFMAKKSTPKDESSAPKAYDVLERLTKGELSVTEAAKIMEKVGHEQWNE